MSQVISIKRMALLCLTLAIVNSGCGAGVREDRTISFSRDGGQVAFQHGDEGVYVANSDGQGLTKIFQPDQSVLATSRPLTSPTDGRLIFATAHDVEGTPERRQQTLGPIPAEGRIVTEGPVGYTCWLRSEARGDQPAEVKKLFEARCNHLGYISGGLAVRWHPDGRHILYCASLDGDPNRHSVFEFDLAAEVSRRVFPHATNAVICDWTPAGSHLVCVAAELNHNTKTIAQDDLVSGIWIGRPEDEKSWWRVPCSERRAEGELPSLIEKLRASRPAWTRDDRQFAFVSRRVADDRPENRGHLLQCVDFGTRTFTTIAEADTAMTDLNWSPDGKQLGFVRREANGFASIHFADLNGNIARLPATSSVRKFAGFDATGRHVSYTVSDRSNPRPDSKPWSTLLFPDTRRDSVRIAPADASNEGREVISGMQVTFPLWSPAEEKLSLWLTFTPRYRSLLSMFLQTGLWPGDPAATIDVQSGSVSWMAISPQEELQVGHYHLLKGNAGEAWKWYTKAHERLPKSKAPANQTAFIRRPGAPENSQLFEYLCLKRLGRNDEAATKWLEFEESFRPRPAETPPTDGQPATSDPVSRWLDDPLFNAFVHDFFIAEVFLSVDGLPEVIAHFRQPAVADQSDAAAYSRAVVLAQLMLIAEDPAGFLEHCTEVLAPLALKLWKPQNPQNPMGPMVFDLSAGLCLTPLFRSEFLEQVPVEHVQRHLPQWKEFAAKYDQGRRSMAINLIVRAASLRLGDSETAQECESRLRSDPEVQSMFDGKSVDEVTAPWTLPRMPPS